MDKQDVAVVVVTLSTILGGAKVNKRSFCGGEMDRGVNGAKNIFLKNFEVLAISVSSAGGLSPIPRVTLGCTVDPQPQEREISFARLSKFLNTLKLGAGVRRGSKQDLVEYNFNILTS